MRSTTAGTSAGHEIGGDGLDLAGNNLECAETEPQAHHCDAVDELVHPLPAGRPAQSRGADPP